MFSNSLEVHYVAEILTLGSTLDKLRSALISKTKRALFGVSDLIKRWKSCFITHEFRDFFLRYRPSSVEKKLLNDKNQAKLFVPFCAMCSIYLYEKNLDASEYHSDRSLVFILALTRDGHL